MIEKFYLVLFSGFKIDSSNLGNPAEWATVFIGLFSLYFTWRGFNYLKTQIGYQKDALDQQATQLTQQKEQFDFQKEQYDQQVKLQEQSLKAQTSQLYEQGRTNHLQQNQIRAQLESENYTLALQTLEVISGKLATYSKLEFFSHSKVFIEGDLSFGTASQWYELRLISFENYNDSLQNKEFNQICRLLISIINQTELVNRFIRNVSRMNLNSIANSVIEDTISLFGPKLIYFLIVELVPIDQGETVDVNATYKIINRLIHSKLLTDFSVNEHSALEHPKFINLNEYYVLSGYNSLILPSNPS